MNIVSCRYHRTCTHNSPAAYAHALYHSGTCSHPSTLAYGDVATERGMRREVYEVGYAAFMIHHGTGVHYAMPSYNGISLHDGSCHHNRTFTHHRPWRNDGRRMHDRAVVSANAAGYTFADGIVTNGYYERFVKAGIQARHHRFAVYMAQSLIVVDETRDALTHCLHDIFYDLAMTRRSVDNHIFIFLLIVASKLLHRDISVWIGSIVYAFTPQHSLHR